MIDNIEKSKLISYIENVFVQIHLAITFNELEKIDHFINDEIYDKLKNKLDKLNRDNMIQMYDLINVTDTKIIEILEDEERIILKVNLTLRYVDYCIDKDTKEKISGNDKERIDKYYNLTFEKKRNTKNKPEIMKCPNCNSNMDININGKCDYCGSIYNLEDYEWILTRMEKQ